MRCMASLLTSYPRSGIFHHMRETYTLEDVRKQLRLKTIAQARHRVNLVKPSLVSAGSVRYGRNNRMELTADGIALLRRMEDAVSSGQTHRDAAQSLVATSGSPEILARLSALESEVASIKSLLASGFTLSLLPRNQS